MVPVFDATPEVLDAPLGIQIYELDGVTPLAKLEFYPPAQGLASPYAVSATQRAIIVDHNGTRQIGVVNMSDVSVRAKQIVVPAPPIGSNDAPAASKLPAIVRKVFVDGTQGAIEGISLANLSNYAHLTTFNQAETALVTIGFAVLHGIVGNILPDIPTVLSFIQKGS